MKLRSGNTTISYLKQIQNYTAEFHKVREIIQKNKENDIINSIRNGTPYINKDYSKPKVIIINKIYTLLFTKFTEIHEECIQNYIRKEEVFIRMLTSLENSSKTVFKDIKESGIEKNIEKEPNEVIRKN